MHMPVSFAVVDLLDDIQPYPLVLFDVVEPVIQFASKLATNYLVQSLLRH